MLNEIEKAETVLALAKREASSAYQFNANSYTAHALQYVCALEQRLEPLLLVLRQRSE